MKNILFIDNNTTFYDDMTYNLPHWAQGDYSEFRFGNDGTFWYKHVGEDWKTTSGPVYADIKAKFDKAKDEMVEKIFGLEFAE